MRRGISPTQYNNQSHAARLVMNRIPAQRSFSLWLLSPLFEKEASTVCNIEAEEELWWNMGTLD